MKIAKRTLPENEFKLFGDISTGRFRPPISKSFRQTIFDRLHSLSHGGIRATRKLISERFVWPKMRTGIRDWRLTYISCQRTKINRRTVAPLQHFATPHGCFASVCVDIVGPLNECDGYTYILTAIDRFTRWPEAIPLRDITAKSCANAFLLNWVARYGCPTTILTDRGRQCTSVLWDEFCNGQK